MDEPPCRHPNFRSVPQPPAGTPCMLCGAPFIPLRRVIVHRVHPDDRPDDVIAIDVDQETVEDLRALFRIWAINLAYNNPEPGDEPMSDEYREHRKELIVDQRGWTEEYDVEGTA